jgi:hypothetical protein
MKVEEVNLSVYDNWFACEHLFGVGDKVKLSLLNDLDMPNRSRDMIGEVVAYDGSEFTIVEWDFDEGEKLIGQVPTNSLTGVFN